MNRYPLLLSLAILFSLSAACTRTPEPKVGPTITEGAGPTSEALTGSATAEPEATAELKDTKNTTLGTIRFFKQGDALAFSAKLTGLAPNKNYAAHVHEGFKCEGDFKNAGEHFNPSRATHGDRSGAARHPGDLGNLKTDASGNILLDGTISTATIAEGTNSIVGHALILHTGEDDLKSQPSGKSGDRLACGTVVMGAPAPGGLLSK